MNMFHQKSKSYLLLDVNRRDDKFNGEKRTEQLVDNHPLSTVYQNLDTIVVSVKVFMKYR